METTDSATVGAEIPRSAEELVRRAAVEPGRLQEIQRDPLSALQKLAQEVVRDVPQGRPIDTDVLLFRMVVGSLGVVSVSSVLGVILLAALTKGIPETLTALGAAAIGCLGGLLAPSPASRR